MHSKNMFFSQVVIKTYEGMSSLLRYNLKFTGMSNSSTPAIMIFPVPAAAGKQPQANVQPTPPSHHSNGSFGTVFIVLAVITVISGLACFIGRLCNKRTLKHQNPKQKQTHRSGGPPLSPYPNPNAPHPNQQQGGRQERDMELGYGGSRQPGRGPEDYSDTDHEFDKRSKSSSSKPVVNGGEGMRGGFSPSPFGPRKPDQAEMHGGSH